jgi:hypothetical protein
MTTIRTHRFAPRTSPCVGRVVPAGSAGLERLRSYAGRIPAGAGRSVLGTANQAEGLCFGSKDTTREVLPT